MRLRLMYELVNCACSSKGLCGLNDYVDAPFKEHELNVTVWTSLVLIYASQDNRLRP